jgi:thiamine pyrophosphate-dependent acetolactate synthase large subunit-like protein
MRVYEAVDMTLKALGVDTVFGVMGDGNMRFGTHMTQECGITYYAARHESAAVSMADAYARVTGKVGVSTVTQGPGLTNTPTPVAEAAKARTALLLLTGASPLSLRWHNQRIDQPALAAAVGAGYEPFRGAGTVISDVARAWRRAALESRPILFAIPTDFQDLEAGPADQALLPMETFQRPVPSPEAVQKMAELVQAAQRPLILAGRGAVRAGAGRLLEDLGTRIGALLVTSAMGRGLFAGNPFDLGIAGGFATRPAARLIGEADLILAFGASLNHWTTRHGSLFPDSAAIVQCDVDPAALGARERVTVGIVGDAAATAAALLHELAARGCEQMGFRTDSIKRAIADYRPEDEFEDESTQDRGDPRSLTIRLNQILPPERTLVVDAGRFSGFPIMYLAVPDPAGFVFATDFQAVGLGLGNAIGAAVARPDRLTVLFIGDGGMMMSLNDLDTAVRYTLPLLIVIINDAAYGAEVYFLQQLGLSTKQAEFNDPDFAAIAKGMGAEGLTVRSLDDLDRIRPWIAHPTGPLVVDCKVNPQVQAEWVREAFGTNPVH